MKKCSNCGGRREQRTSKLPDGVPYEYYHCQSCGEEVLDMKQLDSVAEKYRHMKRYRVRLSTWGTSTGMRIPKELTEKYKFKKEVMIVPEKNGILVLPA